MKIWFIPTANIDQTDEYAAEHMDHYVEPGELTTDHPFASYGLPVIIAESGAVYGPADIYESSWAGEAGDRRNLELEAAAAAAGFFRESNYGETDATY